MSTHIENEVVSMQFDNKHFESNVRTSLSTLEKLKQSLKLHDAAKGFENVNKAARGVNLSPLSGAVDKVGLKFNALYTIADQTLRNIVNSAQRTAKNLVSAFTIDPVKTGFQEYETQLNSVQTILANTQSKGETLETVNAALDELNLYADKTIYNFTEMTRNIGTFTAAGVGLNESVQAIKGIANLAAVSGSTSQQASTAMYQLSQALATGTVRLQDWNSVVNAGMGGELFQNALKRTAEHMGTNVDALIEKYGSFRDSLTQGEWLTTEVLTETLAQLSGAYTEADLIAQGYSKKQAKEIAELAQTADEAATKVKTFTQLMDILKESAQSGWSQTWRLIVGDFEESKTLWTSVSEALGGIIEKSSESRNKLLSGALDNSGWTKMIESVNKAGIEVSDFEAEVKKLAKNNKIDIDAMIKKYGSLEKAILHLEDPTKILKQAFDNLFSPKGKGDKDGDGLKEYLVKEGDTLSELAEKWGTSVEEIMLLNKHIKDPNLILTGWTIEIPGAIEKTGEAAEDATSQVENFRKALNNVGKVSGRDLLIESFANLWGVIKNIVTPIGKAYREVFEPLTSDQIYSGIQKFHSFTEKLLNNESWGDTTENLKDTFKGIFSLVDIIGKVIGGGLKLGWEVLSSVLGHFNLNITDFTAGIGRAITKLNEWLDAGIDKGVGWIIDALKWLYNLPAVQKIIASFSESWTKFKKAFSERWGKGVDAFWDWLERIKQLDGFSIDNVKTALIDFKDKVLMAFFGTVDGGTIFDGLIESVKKFGSVVKSKSSEIWNNIKIWFEGLKELDGFSLENIKKAFIDFYSKVVKPIFVKEDGTTIFDKLVGTVKNFWNIVKGWLGKIGINLDGVKDKILDFFHIDGEFSIGKAWTGLIDKLSTIKDGVTSFLGGIIDFFVENKGKITAYAILIGVGLLFKKFLDVVGLFGDAIQFLPSISDTFEKFTKSLSFSLKASAMKSIAEGIGILVGAIVALCLVPKDRLLPAVGVLTAAVILLGGLFTVMALVTKKIGVVDLTKFAGSILAISGALFIFGLAAKTLAGVEWEDLGKAGAILGAFGVLAVVLSLLSSKIKGVGNSMTGFGSMITKFGIALMLMAGAIKIFGEMDDDVLKKGIACVSILLLELVGIMWATNLLAKTGKKQNIVKMGSIATGLGIALLAMAGAVSIFGNMNRDALIQGMIAVGACMVLMMGLVVSTNELARVGKNGSMVKVGSMFAGMGAALLMIAGAVAIFGHMDTGTLLKGGAAVLVFMGMFVGIMAATKLLATTGADKQFAKVSGMILAFSGALLIIAGAIAILSFFDYKDLLKSTVIIGAIGILMMGLISVTRNIPTKATGTIVALAGSLLIIAVSIAALSHIESGDLKMAAAAIGAMIGLFALLIHSTKSIPTNGVLTIIALGGVVAALAGVLYLLKDIPAKQAIGVAGALGIVVTSLSASLLLISKATSSGNINLRGILMMAVAFAAILGVIAAFFALGVASLPTIGAKLSEFMNNLDDFINGMSKLSAISSGDPESIKSVAMLISAIGEVAASAAKVAVVDAFTNGAATKTLTTFKDWIGQLLPVIKSFAVDISGTTINRENLETVIGAVRMLAECASLVPTVDVAVGGFGSKWGGGGGAVVSVPMLNDAKEWIKGVVPVVKELAKEVSTGDFTVNKDNLDAIVGAVNGLAKATGLAPSIDIAGGFFKTKFASGGGGVVSVPMVTESANWIKGVMPEVKALAEAVTTGNLKELDGEKLTTICTSVTTLAEAASNAPSVEAMGGLFKAGPVWGIMGALSHPMINAATDFIENVREPIIKLANAVSGYAGDGETALKNFKVENFNAIIGGIKTITDAVANGPKVEVGGMLSFGGWSAVTIAGAFSIPMINGLVWFIDNVRVPMVSLAKAVSEITPADSETLKGFDVDTFNAVIGGIKTMSEAAKNAPAVSGGLLLNWNKKFTGLTLAGGISWPLIDSLGTFISNVTDPLVKLANATSGTEPDGIKNFNKGNFETIIGAIAQIAAIKFPSITVGGGIGKFKGMLAAGGVFNAPLVNELSTFISTVSDPIIKLANCVSGVKEGDAYILSNFHVENFKAIVSAIAQIGSIKFPTELHAVGGGGGGGAGVLAIAGGYAHEYADMAGVVTFITDVKDPIIKLANAISGVSDGDASVLTNFNAENFVTIVDAIQKIASIKFNEVSGGGGGGIGVVPALAAVGIGGGGGSTFADFDGTIRFINGVREPIIQLAKDLSGGEGAPKITEDGIKNLTSVINAVVQLSQMTVPEKVTLEGGLWTLIGGGNFEYEKSTQLTEFAGFISSAATSLSTLVTAVSGKDFSVEDGKLSKAVGIISELAVASKDIPPYESVKWGNLTSDKATDFTGFVGFVSEVGGSIATLSTSTKDLNVSDDTSNITKIVTLIKDLALIAKDLPTSELTGMGLLYSKKADFKNFLKFIGGDDSGEEGIGSAIKSLSGKVSDITDDEVSKVITVINAVSNLASAANAIPTLKSDWFSEEGADWDGFTKTIPKFGTAIKNLVTNLGDTNPTDAYEASYAVSNLSDAIYYLSNTTNKLSLSQEQLDKLNQFATDVAGFVVAFKDALPTDVDLSVIKTVDSFISAINSAFDNTYRAKVYDLSEFKQACEELPAIIWQFDSDMSGYDLIDATDAINRLSSAISELASVNLTGATAFSDALSKLATTSIQDFVDTFSSETTKTAVSDAISGMTSTASAAAGSKSVVGDFTTAGEHCGTGFVAGICSKIEDATNAGTALGKAALAAAMAALDENSPSKEFYKVGAFAGIALVNALTDYRDKTYDAGYDMADSAKTGLSNAISKVRGIIENGIDAQPTIRPVLDLTDVSAGANRINSLFGTPSIRTMSRIGTISTMMNGSQNRSNNDVVSAINDLSKRLGNTSGNTYNINGITYDDGSNVTKAVETLVRAAIRERRA